ncbi:TetR/AcrR family transcriptional regulator [Arthrobacter sp. AZCC_0090]|uniref:TetR/AcrR family transcriptional regulator n=1 Tax=Arthrobacter sp. AZCC_0090 TaxID=2735881 RepID=UPI00161830D7|nr:TetR/AcrR family transcriptional regulator [Arthrobacter sp. AZCC_0090]
MASLTPTRPRTRPRNRREMILRAAADLFAAHGYHNVNTEDIAAAAGIGASALYRHFRNKHELLELALASEFQAVSSALAEAAPRDIDSAIAVLARAFGGRPRMGLLWSRESRHLDDPAKQRIRRPFFEVRGTLEGLIRERTPGGDPELTAMAVIAVLTSPAYHQTTLPPDRMIALLIELSMIAVATPLTGHDSARPQPEPDGVTSSSRPSAIMAAATRLFSVRGYQTVTMQDIGAAVGATSASLYRHFPTKGDLLTAIMTRATEALHVGLADALAGAASPREALRATVTAYVSFATRHRDLLGVLVTELPNIPEPDRRRLRAAQREYVSEWFALQAAARPEQDRAVTRFRVHAALAIVNDAVRTTRLSSHPGVVRNIVDLAVSVLEN